MKKLFLYLFILLIISLFINLISHWELLFGFYNCIISKEYANVYTILDSLVSDFSLTECRIVEHIDGKANELYADADLSKKYEYLHQILSSSPATAISKDIFCSNKSEKVLSMHLKYLGSTPSLGKRNISIYLYNNLVEFEITHKQSNVLDTLSVKQIFYPDFFQYRYFRLK